MTARMFSTAKPGQRPALAKCHAAAVCPADAIGWVKPRGPGRMWIPTCARHVGPWTIQGAEYSGPRTTGSEREHAYQCRIDCKQGNWTKCDCWCHR